MISIVIPAYNVDKYLSRCLDSILGQEDFEKHRHSIEIVIINDGSTDNTEQIASKYNTQYEFIKVFSQKNGGLSAARNYGIEKSTGHYIWFIDSDDWIASDSLSVIFNEISISDLDILEFDVVYAIEDKEDFIFKKDPYYSGIATDLVATKDFLQEQGYIASVTSKVIKRRLFIDSEIRFPLSRFSEDNIVALKLMYSSETYRKIKKDIYFYYQRADSITKNQNLSHVRKYISDQILNLKDIDKEIAHYSINTSKIKEMQAFVVSNMIFSLIKNKFSLSEVDHFIHELREINQYPVKRYNYYNQGIKRKLFRTLFNLRLSIVFSKLFT